MHHNSEEQWSIQRQLTTIGDLHACTPCGSSGAMHQRREVYWHNTAVPSAFKRK